MKIYKDKKVLNKCWDSYKSGRGKIKGSKQVKTLAYLTLTTVKHSLFIIQISYDSCVRYHYQNEDFEIIWMNWIDIESFSKAAQQSIDAAHIV